VAIGMSGGSRTVSVVSVPTSAGAFSPGQERAPQVFREGGLERRLADHGTAVEAWLEVDGFTWRPDRDNRRAQHVEEVRRVALDTAARIEALLGAKKRALVLGGDCTVGIGTVAGAVGAGREVGLIYFDRHADLNTPQSVPDGALDWMGMSQILDAADSIEAIAGAFGVRPLLDPSRVVITGADPPRWTPWERQQVERLGVPRIGIDAVCEHPQAAAREALELLGDGCDTLLVHFDLDLLDFVDAPYSENVDRNSGPTLGQATQALEELCSDPRFAAMTLTEVNPAHAVSDDPDLERPAEALASAWGRASARSS
jgi:arginase